MRLNRKNAAGCYTRWWRKCCLLAFPHLFVAVFLALITGCGKWADQADGEFLYEGKAPVDLLRYVQQKSGKPCPSIAVTYAPESWIKETDVAELIPLLQSNEVCANVHSIYSSFMDCRSSTLGKEAAFLIQGYRKGTYPPEMNSGNASFDVDEIRGWWKNYQETR